MNGGEHLYIKMIPKVIVETMLQNLMEIQLQSPVDFTVETKSTEENQGCVHKFVCIPFHTARYASPDT